MDTTACPIELLPHHHRMVQEFDALQKKHQKLRIFLGSNKLHELEPIDQSLLFEQYRVMGLYVNVLEQRIERLAQ